jgi:oligopeptide transport system permease protein
VRGDQYKPIDWGFRPSGWYFFWDEQYGPRKPLWGEMMTYVVGDTNLIGNFECGLICLNLGRSYSSKGTAYVQETLFTPPQGQSFFESKFGYSIRLGLLAVLMAVGPGIPLGILAALKQGTWIDHFSLWIVNIGIAVPGFILAIFMLNLFGFPLYLGVAPLQWNNNLSLWWIPATALGFGMMARIVRFVRGSMIEVLHMDYIRTARAKGLSEWVVVCRHVIKNALLPARAFLDPVLANLLTGVITIEFFLNFPGMGNLYGNSIRNLDAPMIVGITLLFAGLIAAAKLGADIVRDFLDPRIRLSGFEQVTPIERSFSL